MRQYQKDLFKRRRNYKHYPLFSNIRGRLYKWWNTTKASKYRKVTRRIRRL